MIFFNSQIVSECDRYMQKITSFLLAFLLKKYKVCHF